MSSEANSGYLRRAEQLYRQRRSRDKLFADASGQLFGEPAWDILLDLFISHERGQRVRVSSVCIAGCVPTSTALRAINLLVALNLAQREADMADNRVTLVSLTARAVEIMRRYVDAIGNEKSTEVSLTDARYR